MSVSEQSYAHRQAWAGSFASIALVLLGVRFVQGFIFWGGASRRLIYDYQEIAGINHAVKLDFEAAGFVANKMVHALPGSLWVGGTIEWLMTQPELLYLTVWLWTLAELAVGVGLILGLMTRMFALVSVGLNISLMLVFGWMGSTCLDEWTMAVSGFAMSAAIFIVGGGTLSLDHLIFGRMGWVARHGWTKWFLSGELSIKAVRRTSLALAFAGLVFTVGSYNILFGAVVSELHPRVNFHNHHISLSNIELSADGGLVMDAYVDAGPDTGAAYIIGATLLDGGGNTLAEWDGARLAGLSSENIDNIFTYVWASQFKTETIGFSGKTGAKARLTLPASAAGLDLKPGDYRIILDAISGDVWAADFSFSS